MAANCSTCGAQLLPNAPKCPYCGAATPAGERKAREEEQRAAAAAAAAAATAQREQVVHKQQAAAQAEQAARLALTWSIVGLFGCCFVIPPIVGVVLGYRAVRLARDNGLFVPARAIAALTISGASFLLLIGGGIGVAVQQHALAQRKASVHARVDGPSAAATLAPDTACGLAELHLLEESYEGHEPTSVDAVECSGALTQDAKTAELQGVRVTFGGGTPQTITACFTRGTKWSVERFANERCSEPAKPGPESTASAHEPPAPTHPGPRPAPAPHPSGHAKPVIPPPPPH
jgi:hypothetical protein